MSNITPAAVFTNAIHSEKGRFPQAIAHRGYKAEFPENSMKAFEGAVIIGAHALETDVHITEDDVVVLSHVRRGSAVRWCTTWAKYKHRTLP